MPLPSSQGVLLFYLDDAKGRKVREVPIPESTRKKLLERWKKHQEKRRAQSNQDNAPDQESERELKPRSSAKNKPVKELGILDPSEKEAYAQVREKVHVLVRTQKIRERMKEWIDQLKKNSIIEVKL
jgi:hypothetical protein